MPACQPVTNLHFPLLNTLPVVVTPFNAFANRANQNIFTDRSKAMLLLWIIYVISVLFMLCSGARLFIDTLWSPAGKGVTSWLSVSWVRCGA